MKALLLLLGLALATPGWAQQDYPNKPIRLITPAAQGGTTDLLARIFGQRLSEVFGQQVLVDNRASAAGVIAGQLTAQAAPDGYTLLLAYHQHTVNAALNPKLPYHTVNDFTPITQLTSAGLMLVVNPKSPVNNLAEFIQWTKNFQGSLNFGSAGIGSGGHLAGELYKIQTGVKATHIPYKGAGPSLIGLVGGEIDLMISGLSTGLPYIKQKQVRGLAVTSVKRLHQVPDIPAVAETVPGYEAGSWYAILTRAGTPRTIIDRLNREVAIAIKSPDVNAKLIAGGVDPEALTPEQLGAKIRAETERWGKVVKAAGIKPL